MDQTHKYAAGEGMQMARSGGFVPLYHQQVAVAREACGRQVDRGKLRNGAQD
jgi:hypothetical protein